MKKLYILWLLVVLIGFLALLILATVWQYIVFALLFAIIFSKNYRYLSRFMHPNLAAVIVVLGVMALLVVPTLYVIAATVDQAPAAYTSTIAALGKDNVRALFGLSGDEVRNFLVTIGEKLKQNVLENASVYISQISNVLLGLFVLFITLFFLLRDGSAIYSYLIRNLPVSKRYAQSFFLQMDGIVHAVILGQVVTAFIQGLLGGILFWALGIPNPIFWGAIMVLLSIIPVLGPFLVYLPASAYLVLQERYAAGIIMLLFGVIVLSQIDNVLRPYIASRESRIHPLTVILGVIGGLKLWGLAGFVLGPLVLAAFIVLYEFSVQNWTSR